MNGGASSWSKASRCPLAASTSPTSRAMAVANTRASAYSGSIVARRPRRGAGRRRRSLGDAGTTPCTRGPPCWRATTRGRRRTRRLRRRDHPPRAVAALRAELSGGDPDIAGDRVVECPTAGELGDENPGEGGNDGDAGQPHPAGSLRRRCLDRCGLLPRLDCSKHPSGAGGVVGLQRFVVGVVEIAGGVLGLEIVERPEQEVTLLAERRIDAHPRSAIACSTSTWSSSVASRSASRCHRRNTRPRPVTATAPPTTGGSTRGR